MRSNLTHGNGRSRGLRASMTLILFSVLVTSGAAHADSHEKASAAAAPLEATIKTSLGNIVVALDSEKAPNTVANFVQYAKDGSYDGTIFHRVIGTFMIQGGGFDKELNKRPIRSSIKNEANNGLKNERGTIAMARTGDPHSATNQFFINVKRNGSLDHRGENSRGWGYAVFGKVVQGMDVVDAIKAVETGACGRMFPQDCPQTPVEIIKVTISGGATS